MTSFEFWSRHRVVVTGGAGFLGSAVVANLHSRGCKRVDPELLRAMGERNRSYSEAFFDERKLFEAQRQFLLRIVRSRA